MVSVLGSTKLTTESAIDGMQCAVSIVDSDDEVPPGLGKDKVHFLRKVFRLFKSIIYNSTQYILGIRVT